MPCDASNILQAMQAHAAGVADLSALDPDALGRAVVAAVKTALPQASWVGIYWLRRNELVLGPYEGAATEHERIPIGQGVCGTAVATDTDQVVRDVRDVENYLACSADVRSEVVVLIRSHGRVIGQLDLDANEVDAFSRDDYCVLRTVADGFGGLLAPQFPG
jgi:L-methionine (R)-S-oxide reductase